MLYTYINGIKKYLVLPKIEPALIASYKNGNILNLYRVPLDGSSTDSHVEYNCPISDPFILYDDKIKKIIIAHPNKTTIDNDLSIVVSTLDPNTLNIQQTFSSPFWEPGTSYNDNILSYTYNPVKHILTVCQSNRNNASSAHLIIYDLLNFKVFTKTIEFNNGNSLRVMGCYWIEDTNKLRIAVCNNGNYTLNTSTNKYEKYGKFYVYDVNITTNETNVESVFNWTNSTISYDYEPDDYLPIIHSNNNLEQMDALFFRISTSYENYQYLGEKPCFYSFKYNKLKEGTMNSYNVISPDQSAPILSLYGPTGKSFNTYSNFFAFSRYYNGTDDGNNRVQYNYQIPTFSNSSNVANGYGNYGTYIHTNRDNPNNISLGGYFIYNWDCSKCYIFRYNTYFINNSDTYANKFNRYALSFIYYDIPNTVPTYKELFVHESRTGVSSDVLPAYYRNTSSSSINYDYYRAISKKYLGILLKSNRTQSGNVRYVDIIKNDNINQSDVQLLDCWQNSNLTNVDFRPATVVY